jgi:WD40 repeat protein
MNHFSDVKAGLWAGLLCILVALCRGSTGPVPDSTNGALPAYALCRLGSTQFLLDCGQTDYLTYSANGRYLASAGFSTLGAAPPAICVWEVATGKNVTPQGLHGVEPTGISWAPTGAQFVTSHVKRPGVSSLNLWTIGHSDPVILGDAMPSCFSVVWSPRGDCIATYLQDSSDVVLLDLQGKELRRVPFVEVKGVTRSMHVIEFTPDGQQLIVGAQGRVCFYQVNTGATTHELELSEEEQVWAIRHFPKSEILAISINKGLSILHYTKPTSEILIWGEKRSVTIAVSPDEHWVAAAGFGHSSLWDMTTETRKALKLSENRLGLAFDPDGTELALGTERISFLKTGTWQNVRDADEHLTQIVSGVISENRFWSGGVGSMIREWDYERGIGLRILRRKTGTTVALAKIDDQRMAIAGGIPEIEIRDLLHDKTLFTLPGHGQATTSVVYSDKHRRLISAGWDGKIRGWGIESQLQVFETSFTKEQESTKYPRLVGSPDGETFACMMTMNSGVQLFSVATGKRLWTSATSKGQMFLLPLAFTPDSQQIACLVESADQAAGNETFSVKILNANSGEEVARLNCQAFSIHSISISPDGQFAALCISLFDDDREIQIWSLESHTLVASLPGLRRYALAACFSPDGEKLITVSTDTTGMVWDVKRAIRNGFGKRR